MNGSNAAASPVQCRFVVSHFPTGPNQHLVLVGSTPALGNWNPTAGLRLHWGPGHTWQGTVELPAGDIDAKVRKAMARRLSASGALVHEA
jgi:hypothetical protein